MHKKQASVVCSGGILGLNETLEQRVEMAFELKRLHIDSVPLNILNPVKGTPFEQTKLYVHWISYVPSPYSVSSCQMH